MLCNNFFSHIIFTSYIFILLSLTACDLAIENNLPDIPPQGRFAAVSANQHNGISSVEVATAIFDDGDPVNLVGGDVVQASTINNSTLLLEDGFYKGSYATSLANDSNLDQINILMIHAPLEARQGRWYPVGLLNIDPGPGEFVGASASITLPPEPLNISLSSSNFNSIDDSFIITWSPEASADIMKVNSVVRCTNSTKTYTYGTVANLSDESDDGTEVIGLDQFIYDINSETKTIEFILGESRAALLELLQKLKTAGIGETFFSRLALINPIESECNIQLFLFRSRSGNFDSLETNGRISGSRSADINLFYKPS